MKIIKPYPKKQPNKPKEPIIYNGIKFESTEELEFCWWCEEALKHGFITRWNYHPPKMELLDRASYKEIVHKAKGDKVVDRFLLHPHSYQPDFEFEITDRMQAFEHGLFGPGRTIYVDTKGTENNQKTRRNSDIKFPINQKIVWYVYGILINKIVPKTFFSLTWVPQKARFSPKIGKLRDCYRNHRTINQAVLLPLNFPEPVLYYPQLDKVKQPELFAR